MSHVTRADRARWRRQLRAGDTRDILPEPAFGTLIPRIIHQIYIAPRPASSLPDKLEANVRRIRDGNPDFRHVLYDDDMIRRFIADHYGAALLDYYSRIDGSYGAAKADFFRYLAVYALGGVYLDIKSAVEGRVFDRIDPRSRYVVCQWRNGPDEPHPGWGLHREIAEVPGGEYQQWHVMAAPGHPFLRRVIEAMMRMIDDYHPLKTGTGYLGVWQTTGPILYTRAIHPILNDHPHVLHRGEETLGLRYSIFDASDHKAAFKNHYVTNRRPVVIDRSLTGRINALRARLR